MQKYYIRKIRGIVHGCGKGRFQNIKTIKITIQQR